MSGLRAWVRTALIAAFVFAASRPASAGDMPGPTVLNLHERPEVLAHESGKGKKVFLPRLLLFDAQGRLVAYQPGYADRIDYLMRRSLERDQPVSDKVNLALAVGETLDANGNAVAVDSLPKADAYVLDYWAEWCSPCHMLERDLQRFLPRWSGVRVVWLKIEADPEKAGHIGAK